MKVKKIIIQQKKVLIMLDDMITDMEANPKVNPIVNCYELFLRWKRKTQLFYDKNTYEKRILINIIKSFVWHWAFWKKF